MDTVKLPVSQRDDTEMDMEMSVKNANVSIAREFQKHLSNAS